MTAAEWVYEEAWRLPFGWRVIRLKGRLRGSIGELYRSPLLYKKIEIEPGTFREVYWPKSPYKGIK